MLLQHSMHVTVAGTVRPWDSKEVQDCLMPVRLSLWPLQLGQILKMKYKVACSSTLWAEMLACKRQSKRCITNQHNFIDKS